MTFAAQHADIIGVNPSLPGAPDASTSRDALGDAIDRKFDVIRQAAGARFDQLEFNAWISVASITSDTTSLGQKLSKRFGAPLDDVLQSPLILVGSVDQVVERLHTRRDRWGYSYTVLQADQAHAFAPVIAQLAAR